MTSATVQINFFTKRLLNKSEAAVYCCRSIKRFGAEFPYPPVSLGSAGARP